MFRINHSGDAPGLLSLGDGVYCKGGLTAGFGTVDLDNPAAGQTADAGGGVKCDGAGGDGGDIHGAVFAQTHDGAFAVAFFNLGQGGFEGFLFVGHGQFLRSVQMFVKSYVIISYLHGKCKHNLKKIKDFRKKDLKFF